MARLVALLALLAVVVLVGCAGMGGGSERGGWSLFQGGISCRDCEQLVFSTRDDVYEVAHDLEVPAGQRIEGWYESPIAAGTPLEISWRGPRVTELATRTAAPQGGWVEHEHSCQVDGDVADPSPAHAAAPAPAPTASSEPTTCLWRHTPTEPLAAPDNGITIRWEVQNGGPATMTLSFRAGYGPG